MSGKQLLSCFTLAAFAVIIPMTSTGAAAEPKLPASKPVPDVQVIPLPYEQASFQHLGRELTRFHFGPSLRRPFCYPLVGPSGRSHTRMGNPEAPHGERHHYSAWITHMDIDGVSFWEDNADGRIICRSVDRYTDGPQCASLLCLNAWQTATGKVLMQDRRRISVIPMENGHWMMVVDLQLEAPPGKSSVNIGQSAYGVFAVRVAKTISVSYGGGRVLNSQGHLNEQQSCHKRAKWMDYSGPIAGQATGGITLLDHPKNPSHPTSFIVRNNGWMSASLTKDGPLTVKNGKPIRLRYGLWIHADVPTKEEIERQWKLFVDMPHDTDTDISKLKTIR